MTAPSNVVRRPWLGRGKLALGLLALVVGAALLVTSTSSSLSLLPSTSVTGKKLVAFHIAAVPVNNPDKPPSDTAQAGGILGYAIHLGGFQRELEQAGFAYQGVRGFPRTAACMLALTSGQVEVAVTGDSPAVLSRARGDKHRAIYVTLPSTETWIVARKAGPRSIQELAGRKVGTLFGSTMDYYFQAAIAKLGIQGVEYAQLQASAALPALQNNALDAYLTTSANGALWQQAYGLPVIAKLNEIDPKLRGIGITTAREDFLSANPKFSGAYFRGIKTAIDAIQADKEAYLRWESSATGVPVELLRASNTFRYSDTPVPEESILALEEQLAFRLATNVANAPFDVRQWVVSGSAAEGQAR